MSDQPPAGPTVEALVVGMGFAGMAALHQLRAAGVHAQAVEAASGPGGVWWWNRYPGARCDVQSLWYSYGFSNELQQDWVWTEKYATQPEILRYAAHVAERFGLNDHVRYDTRVERADFDEATDLWRVRLDDGQTISARFLVAAVGCLSSASLPQVPGLARFRGRTFHTGQWPHEEVDFADRRVAVIGTGSSGIQVIPELAKHASTVTVLQRTPNYSIPARNRPLAPDEQDAVKAQYPQIRAQQRRSAAGALHRGTGQSVLEVDEPARRAALEEGWAGGGTAFMATFTDILTNHASNDLVAEFVRERIAETVTDPATAERLTPKGYPIGAKRICVDDHYFETFNRANVELVDVRETPITSIDETGVHLGDRHLEIDDLIFATGYDAMTGSLLRLGLHGVKGQTLETAWREGPKTYLGVSVAGFPNLFICAGPGSPSVLVNGIMAGEQHAEWITDLIRLAVERGISRIEARSENQAEWVAEVNAAAARTLFNEANSWYVGANVPGKPRVFMPYTGGFATYVDRCAQIAATDYDGFALSSRVEA